MRDGIKGLIVGMLLGGLAGFGISRWMPQPFFFEGDLAVAGALFLGLCGYIWEDDLLDYLKENWFWRLIP